MGWRLIKVQDTDTTEADLTDSEVVGVSVSLASTARKSVHDDNVYLRAWKKIQTVVEVANNE